MAFIFVSSSEVAGDCKSLREKLGPETPMFLCKETWSSLNRGPKAESFIPLSKPSEINFEWCTSKTSFTSHFSSLRLFSGADRCKPAPVIPARPCSSAGTAGMETQALSCAEQTWGQPLLAGSVTLTAGSAFAEAGPQGQGLERNFKTMGSFSCCQLCQIQQMRCRDHKEVHVEIWLLIPANLN